MKHRISRLSENKWFGLALVLGMFFLNAVIFVLLSIGGAGEDQGEGIFVPDGDVDYWQTRDVRLTGHFVRDIEADERVFLFLDNLSVSVYRNDELVYKNYSCIPYGSDLIKNVAFKTSDTITLEAATGRKLFYNGSLKSFLDKLAVGRRTDVALSMMRIGLWKLLIILFLYLLGNNLLMYPLEYDEDYSRRLPELYSCGLTILTGATVALIGSDFVIVLSNNPRALVLGNLLFRTAMIISLLIYLFNRMSHGTLALVVFAVSIAVDLLVRILMGVRMTAVLSVGLIIFAVRHYIQILKEGILQRRQARRAKELEMEVMESRMDIMRSQVQPHFLFNALGTIKALFLRDPKEARYAIDYLAKFLRGNMEALGRREKISFSQEMDIVDSYLYIEKIRFGDRIAIEKNLLVEDFTLPSMTVQMLVENGVKHGLQDSEEGGTISISTSETDGYIEIEIKDDGVGFDMNAKPDGKVHVGISHTRQLIENLCDGELIIDTSVGKGTTALIRIPRRDN